MDTIGEMTSPRQTNSDLSAFAGSWILDPDQTTIEFHTKAVYIIPVKGTAKATEGGGTVSADGGVTGTLVIDAASIDTKNKKRDEHLRSEDFFEVIKYPAITFTVTEGASGNGGKVQISGNLEVHGQTRPLTVAADIAVSGNSAVVSTEMMIDRSDWGISKTPFGARLHNRVVINARFNRV
jgi:polyisoprenoid-binding protein YceI